MVEGVERRQRVDRLTVSQDASPDPNRIPAELHAIAAKLLKAKARRAQRFYFADGLTGPTCPHRGRLPADRAPCVGVSGNQAKRPPALDRHDQGGPRALHRLNELRGPDRIVGAVAADRLSAKQSIKQDELFLKARYALGRRPAGKPAA